MFRWIFTIAALVSGLICAIMLFVGVWSYFGNVDWVGHLPGGIELSASGCAGKARLGITRWGAESDKWWQNRPGRVPMVVTGETVVISQSPPTVYAVKTYVNFGVHEWHGFEWRSGAMSRTPTTAPTGVMSMALVPYWSGSVPCIYGVGVFAVLPGAWVIVRLRRGKVAAGCCEVCGYDLRGSPDRCPECGAVPGK